MPRCTCTALALAVKSLLKKAYIIDPDVKVEAK